MKRTLRALSIPSVTSLSFYVRELSKLTVKEKCQEFFELSEGDLAELISDASLEAKADVLLHAFSGDLIFAKHRQF